MAGDQQSKKKEGERRVLEAARAVGLPIPAGEIPGEQPDFRLITPAGVLGIEISEFPRPASSNHGISPIKEEAVQEAILRDAQKRCTEMGIPDLTVLVYFAPARGREREKRKLTDVLADVVAKNYRKATPTWSLAGPALHEDFGQITITTDLSGPGRWWSNTGGGISVSQISVELASRIAAKNALLPTYRANLPEGAEVWLLLYSLPSVSRSVPMVYAMNDWAFSFEFDRVFWYACIENQVAEIRRVNRVAIQDPSKWMTMDFVCACGTKCHLEVELRGGQFGTEVYQHCAAGDGRCVPGKLISKHPSASLLP
jgi:hypothetical protein